MTNPVALVGSEPMGDYREMQRVEKETLLARLQERISGYRLPPSVQAVIDEGVFTRLHVRAGVSHRGDYSLGVVRKPSLFRRHLELQRFWDHSPGRQGLVGQGWDYEAAGNEVILPFLYDHQHDAERCKIILMQAALWKVICDWRSQPANRLWDALYRVSKEAGVDLPIIGAHRHLLPAQWMPHGLSGDEVGAGSYELALRAISELLEISFAKYAFTIVTFADAPPLEV